MRGGRLEGRGESGGRCALGKYGSTPFELDNISASVAI